VTKTGKCIKEKKEKRKKFRKEELEMEMRSSWCAWIKKHHFHQNANAGGR